MRGNAGRGPSQRSGVAMRSAPAAARGGTDNKPMSRPGMTTPDRQKDIEVDPVTDTTTRARELILGDQDARMIHLLDASEIVDIVTDLVDTAERVEYAETEVERLRDQVDLRARTAIYLATECAESQAELDRLRELQSTVDKSLRRIDRRHTDVEQPRTRRIDTVEQLDALPEFSIAGIPMPSGHLFAIQKDTGWRGVDHDGPLSRDELSAALDEYGSYRLLWAPEGD